MALYVMQAAALMDAHKLVPDAGFDYKHELPL